MASTVHSFSFLPNALPFLSLLEVQRLDVVLDFFPFLGSDAYSMFRFNISFHHYEMGRRDPFLSADSTKTLKWALLSSSYIDYYSTLFSGLCCNLSLSDFDGFLHNFLLPLHDSLAMLLLLVFFV